MDGRGGNLSRLLTERYWFDSCNLTTCLRRACNSKTCLVTGLSEKYGEKNNHSCAALLSSQSWVKNYFGSPETLNWDSNRWPWRSPSPASGLPTPNMTWEEIVFYQKNLKKGRNFLWVCKGPSSSLSPSLSSHTLARLPNCRSLLALGIKMDVTRQRQSDQKCLLPLLWLARLSGSVAQWH